MSLPDTIFIFILALVIFGPKKLPEIGRQIGRLVGEFRRASNEFKFQIEEELRQADLNDKKAQRQSIAAQREPEPENRILEENRILDESAGPIVSSSDLSEAVPVGQHPNIAHLDAASFQSEAVPAGTENKEPSDVPRISAAEGSEPRNNAPYVYTEAVTELPNETRSTAQNGNLSSTNGVAESAEVASFADERGVLKPSLTHADSNHG